MPSTEEIAKSYQQFLEDEREKEEAWKKRMKNNDRDLSRVGLSRESLNGRGYTFDDYDRAIRVGECQRSVGRLSGDGVNSEIFIGAVAIRRSEIEAALNFRTYLDAQGVTYVDLKWEDVLGKLEEKRRGVSKLIRKVRRIV